VANSQSAAADERFIVPGGSWPAGIQPRPRTTSASAAYGSPRPTRMRSGPTWSARWITCRPAWPTGRREDALAAIEEVAQVYRELAARWPDALLPAGTIVATCWLAPARWSDESPRES